MMIRNTISASKNVWTIITSRKSRMISTTRNSVEVVTKSESPNKEQLDTVKYKKKAKDEPRSDVFDDYLPPDIAKYSMLKAPPLYKAKPACRCKECRELTTAVSNSETTDPSQSELEIVNDEQVTAEEQLEFGDLNTEQLLLENNEFSPEVHNNDAPFLYIATSACRCDKCRMTLENSVTSDTETGNLEPVNVEEDENYTYSPIYDDYNDLLSHILNKDAPSLYIAKPACRCNKCSRGNEERDRNRIENYLNAKLTNDCDNYNKESIIIDDDNDVLSSEILNNAFLYGAPPLYKARPACRCEECNKLTTELYFEDETTRHQVEPIYE